MCLSNKLLSNIFFPPMVPCCLTWPISCHEHHPLSSCGGSRHPSIPQDALVRQLSHIILIKGTRCRWTAQCCSFMNSSLNFTQHGLFNCTHKLIFFRILNPSIGVSQGKQHVGKLSPITLSKSFLAKLSLGNHNCLHRWDICCTQPSRVS